MENGNGRVGSLDTLCRFCLSTLYDDAKLNIFRAGSQCRNIIQKILSCLSLIVSEDDSLPKHICSSCADKLDNFQEFRDTCHKSESLLIKLSSLRGVSVDDVPKARANEGQMGLCEEPVEQVLPTCDIPVRVKLENLQDAFNELPPTPVVPSKSSILQQDSNMQNELPEEEMCAEVTSGGECGSSATAEFTEGASASCEEGVDGGEAFPSDSKSAEMTVKMEVNDLQNMQSDMNIDSKSGANVLTEHTDTSRQSVDQDIDNNALASPECTKPSSETHDKETELSVAESDYPSAINYTETSYASDIGEADQSNSSQTSNPHAEEEEVILLSDDSDDDVSVVNSETRKAGRVSGSYGEYSSSSAVQGAENMARVYQERSTLTQSTLAQNIFKGAPNFKRLMLAHCKDEPIRVKLDDLFSRDLKFESKLDMGTPNINFGFKPQREVVNLSTYCCMFCGKPYKTKASYLRHLQSHMERKKYSCPICHKCFSQKWNIVPHMRTHTGEKPFRCILCDKTFTQKIGLQDHMKVHSGKRPFVCHLCNRGFARKCLLNDHFHVHFPHGKNQTKM